MVFGDKNLNRFFRSILSFLVGRDFKIILIDFGFFFFRNWFGLGVVYFVMDINIFEVFLVYVIFLGFLKFF